METVYLARGADWSGFPGAVASAWRWSVQHPVVVLAIVAAWGIFAVWQYRWSKRQAREPSAQKATVRGTAQVLSFKQTKAVAWNDPSVITSELWGYSSGPGKTAPHWCDIRLQVHIPGRGPYVTVIKKLLGRMTVQVRVDPNDDPKNVLIDLSQPIT
jgi:hypothetical protein